MVCSPAANLVGGLWNRSLVASAHSAGALVLLGCGGRCIAMVAGVAKSAAANATDQPSLRCQTDRALGPRVQERPDRLVRTGRDAPTTCPSWRHVSSSLPRRPLHRWTRPIRYRRHQSTDPHDRLCSDAHHRFSALHYALSQERTGDRQTHFATVE